MMPFLFSLLLFGGGVQNSDSSGCIRIRIMEDTVFVTAGNPKDEVKITIRASNCSGVNLLCFNLGGIMSEVNEKDSYFEDPNISPGFGIFILGPSGRVYYNDRIRYDGRIPSHRFVVEELRKVYMGNTKVIKSNSEIALTKSFDFDGYNLSAGEYSLYIIYFVGKRYVELADIEQVANDQKRDSAVIFQGFAISNHVRLVVK